MHGGTDEKATLSDPDVEYRSIILSLRTAGNGKHFFHAMALRSQARSQSRLDIGRTEYIIENNSQFRHQGA